MEPFLIPQRLESFAHGEFGYTTPLWTIGPIFCPQTGRTKHRSLLSASPLRASFSYTRFSGVEVSRIRETSSPSCFWRPAPVLLSLLLALFSSAARSWAWMRRGERGREEDFRRLFPLFGLHCMSTLAVLVHCACLAAAQ